MVVIHFPRHRQYDAQRVDANNAVMALLAGSKLAESVLHLTAGSDHRLAELFPRVSHVERLNLRTSEARVILAEAENHVGAMAIPYVLSIHEDFIVSLCTDLAGAGAMPPSELNNLGPANMHERLESACSSSVTPDTLRLFHFLRLVRNAQIHYAGRVHKALADYSARMTRADETLWEQITGNPIPRYSLYDRLDLSVFELIGTLAISKRLAEDANSIFQMGLPRAQWVDIVIEDWAAARRTGNRAEKVRNAFGFARFQYGPLSISKVEIESALSAKRLI